MGIVVVWIFVLLVVLAVVAGVRPAGRAEIDGFAAAAGIQTTETSRRFIGHYLATSRRRRTVLVVAALVLPGLVAEALGVHRTGYSAPLQWVLVACMLGTLWAELTLTRPSAPQRAASLLPRRPAAYLARPLRWGPAVAGLASAAVWLGVPFLPEPQPGDWLLPSSLEVAVAVAVGLIVPVLATAAECWILARPQPVVSEDLLVADHAVRASSVRMVAAMATIMGLGNLVGGLVTYSGALPGPLAAVCAVLTVASLIGCLAAWSFRRSGVAPLPPALRREPARADT